MQGLLNQLQVIHALVIRETRTRFGRHRLGYIWALIEPCSGIGTFAALFYIVGRGGPSGMAVLPFLTTGFLTYYLFTKVADRCVVAINANKGLLFYPQVTPLNLVLARAVLEAVTLLVVFTLLLSGYSFATRELSIADPLTVLLGLVLAAGLGTSFGLMLCGLSVFWETTERIWGPLSRPLFWISGIFFTAHGMPSGARELLLYNPLLHCTELVRGGWFGGYSPHHHGSVAYVAAWILVTLYLGLTLERVARRSVDVS